TRPRLLSLRCGQGRAIARRLMWQLLPIRMSDIPQATSFGFGRHKSAGRQTLQVKLVALRLPQAKRPVASGREDLLAGRLQLRSEDRVGVSAKRLERLLTSDTPQSDGPVRGRCQQLIRGVGELYGVDRSLSVGPATQQTLRAEVPDLQPAAGPPCGKAAAVGTE